MKIPISRLRVADDQDLVRVRRHARLIAEAAGLPIQDQTRLITALSEIARNAVQHAGGGAVDFMLRGGEADTMLEARVYDEGPGIADVQRVMSERFADRGAKGLGVAGSRRLVQRFEIETGDNGSNITLGMRIPPGERRRIQTIAQEAADALAEAASEDPHEELVRQNRALAESLAEKDFLIREIHHRVKNNFQLISSLARLQARRAEGVEAKSLLESLAVRIRALGLAHEQLYQFDDLSRVNLQAFVNQLCTSLESAFVTPGQEVHIHCQVRDDLVLNQDEAMDVGVILNELVTNAIKHGFPGDRSGDVTIASEMTDDELILMVSDNGVGNPDFSKLALDSESLGMRLLNSSVRKLNGEVEFLDPEQGAAVRITLPRARGKSRAFQAVI